MMDKIGRSVEADPVYSARIHFTETPAEATTADALSESAAQIVGSSMPGDGLLHRLGIDRSTHRPRARPGADPGMTASMKVAGGWAAVGRPCGPHPRRQQFRGNGRQGQADGAAPSSGRGRRPVLLMAGVPFKTAVRPTSSTSSKSSVTNSKIIRAKAEASPEGTVPESNCHGIVTGLETGRFTHGPRPDFPTTWPTLH
jgi:hypothetical protein